MGKNHPAVPNATLAIVVPRVTFLLHLRRILRPPRAYSRCLLPNIYMHSKTCEQKRTSLWNDVVTVAHGGCHAIQRIFYGETNARWLMLALCVSTLWRLKGVVLKATQQWQPFPLDRDRHLELSWKCAKNLTTNRQTKTGPTWQAGPAVNHWHLTVGLGSIVYISWLNQRRSNWGP